jgi:hypothetical protein
VVRGNQNKKLKMQKKLEVDYAVSGLKKRLVAIIIADST